jgi:ribosome-binding factor A
MPREYSRAARIADQIQRDLSELIRQEIKDPRIGLVTITGVDVSRDLSHAKVYVSSLSDTDSTEQSVRALQHASGFLRTQLGRNLQLRSIPQLHFVHDISIERGMRLSHLIDEAVAGEPGAVTERKPDDG